MLGQVAGYYNEGKIILNEGVQWNNGQKVIVTAVLSEQDNVKRKSIDFSKYRMDASHNFPMDAQDYVRELRANDRF